MKKCLYVIRDVLAESIVGGLLLFPTDAPAVRFFGDVINEPKSSVSAHPNDHVLTYLGSIDETDGRIDVSDAPRDVITGASYIASRESVRAD